MTTLLRTYNWQPKPEPLNECRIPLVEVSCPKIIVRYSRSLKNSKLKKLKIKGSSFLVTWGNGTILGKED